MVLGIDVGTSWCKAGLFNAQGKIVATHRVPSMAGKAKVCASDDDLRQWWEAVAAAVRPVAALATPESIALACRGYGYYLCFDEQMNAQSLDGTPSISAQASYDAPDWGPGGAWACAYAPKLVAQLKWMRENHPLLHSKIARAGSLHAYLLWRLTGAWVTDPCNGPSGLPPWPKAALLLSGLGLGAFAEVRGSEQVVGELLSGPADDLGLPAGRIVACGGHDGALANLGGGAHHVGDAMITLGTNTVLRIVTGGPVGHWFGYPIPPGNYAWVNGISGTGPAVAAAADQGEKAHRKALEQVVAAVLELLARARALGLQPHRFTITGGLSNLPLLCSLLTEALGVPLYRADPEAGMRGAAMLAAVAAGWYSDVESAAYGMRFGQSL